MCKFDHVGVSCTFLPNFPNEGVDDDVCVPCF